MWKSFSPKFSGVLSDDSLAAALTSFQNGIVVLETGVRGTCRHVICQLRREAKNCAVLSANHLAKDLVRGICEAPEDPRKFIRERILENQTNILLITEDVGAKHGTQTELGHLFREISSDRAIILVCKNVRTLDYMLCEFEHAGHLFCWEDETTTE